MPQVKKISLILDEVEDLICKSGEGIEVCFPLSGGKIAQIRYSLDKFKEVTGIDLSRLNEEIGKCSVCEKLEFKPPLPSILKEYSRLEASRARELAKAILRAHNVEEMPEIIIGECPVHPNASCYIGQPGSDVIYIHPAGTSLRTLAHELYHYLKNKGYIKGEGDEEELAEEYAKLITSIALDYQKKYIFRRENRYSEMVFEKLDKAYEWLAEQLKTDPASLNVSVTPEVLGSLTSLGFSYICRQPWSSILDAILGGVTIFFSRNLPSGRDKMMALEYGSHLITRPLEKLATPSAALEIVKSAKELGASLGRRDLGGVARAILNIPEQLKSDIDALLAEIEGYIPTPVQEVVEVAPTEVTVTEAPTVTVEAAPTEVPIEEVEEEASYID